MIYEGLIDDELRHFILLLWLSEALSNALMVTGVTQEEFLDELRLLAK